MTNKKHLLIYIFIIVCSFFSFSKTISAEPINDECVDKNKCLVLCNYNVKINEGGSNSTGYQSTIKVKSITIYYMFDGTYKLRYSPYNSVDKAREKGPMEYSKLFSKKETNVFWDGLPDQKNFVCPKNGYVDRDGMSLGEEICFDNDGKNCEEKHSNMGTKFGKKGSDFLSQEKDYDFQTHIRTYGEKWSFGDIKEEIKNGTINPKTDLKNKLSNDFKESFLHGNSAPLFIQNSKAYKDLENNAISNFNKIKNEAIKEIDESVINNEITVEEAEKQKENFNVSDEEITTQVEDAKEEIIKPTENDKNNNINGDMNCNALFGDITEPNDPAYWIQWSLNLMKYIAIIALLVLSTMDFLKAMVNQDKDGIQKAMKTTAKRFIFAVLLFFLPIIVEFIMNLFGAYGTCGLG